MTRPLALSPTLAIPLIHRASAPSHMGNNKKKFKASSNGHRPRNGTSRSATNHVTTAARAQSRGSVEQSSTGSPNHNVRTYEIPDYRLEHPNFSVRQLTEKDRQGQEHVRYEVTGDLNAPVPPIRDSKYLDKQQAIESTATCCSTARWRSPSKISTNKARW